MGDPCSGGGEESLTRILVEDGGSQGSPASSLSRSAQGSSSSLGAGRRPYGGARDDPSAADRCDDDGVSSVFQGGGARSGAPMPTESNAGGGRSGSFVFQSGGGDFFPVHKGGGLFVVVLGEFFPHKGGGLLRFFCGSGSRGGGDLSWDLRHDGTRSKGGGDFVEGASPPEERHDGGRRSFG